MRKAFNAKAAKAVGVEILKRHFDPHADAYLLLGRTRGIPEHFVAWQSRHRKNIVDGTCFDTGAAARQHFERMIEDQERSEHPQIEKDWQQDAVYAWEEEFIFPLCRTLAKHEVQALTRRIARDYKISVGELVWGEEYDEEDGIALYRGDIDDISFLHEMAHHIHDHRQNGDIPAAHSPGFVAVAIELYHRYAGIDRNRLIESAAAKNILGDPGESRLILKDIEIGAADRNANRGKPRKPPHEPKLAA